MTRITPEHPQPINPEQARILSLAAQLPPLPKGSRRYVPGDEGHEQALDLFEQACGHRPSYLYVENWQELLDSAVSDEDARAFFESRDWDSLEIQAGAGLHWNIEDVGSPARAVLLGGEAFTWRGGAELHVYPSLTRARTKILLDVLQERGLLEPMLEHMPKSIRLQKDEVASYLIRVGDDLWYEHEIRQQFGRVLSVSEPRQYYIDADDDFSRTPPDGNGWTVWVRDYELGDVIGQDDPRYAAVAEARDLKAAMNCHSWVAGYLESLSPVERQSREQAELAAYRDATLAVYQGEDGLWHTIKRDEVEYSDALGHLKQTEEGWKHLKTGLLYHKDAGEFVQGAGPDVNGDWETL